MKYRAIPTNKGTDNRLYSVADVKSNSKIDIKPLVIPQPKQVIPNKFLIGHKDVEKIFVKINSTTKKTNPTPKEFKVCLFLALLFGILHQRLSITVSETTGQYRNQVNYCTNTTNSICKEMKNSTSYSAYIHSVKTTKSKESYNT